MGQNFERSIFPSACLNAFNEQIQNSFNSQQIHYTTEIKFRASGYDGNSL